MHETRSAARARLGLYTAAWAPRLGQDASLRGVPLSRVRAGAAGVEGDLRDAARGGKQVALDHVVRVRLPRAHEDH